MSKAYLFRNFQHQEKHPKTLRELSGGGLLSPSVETILWAGSFYGGSRAQPICQSVECNLHTPAYSLLSKGRFIYMTVKLLKTSLVSKFWGAIKINIFSMGKKTIILNLTKSHQKCAVIKYTEHPRWQRQRLLKRSASVIVLQTIIKYVRTMAAGIPAQRKMGYVAAPYRICPAPSPDKSEAVPLTDRWSPQLTDRAMCFMFSGRPEPAAAPAQAAEEEATLRDGVTQAAAEGQTDSANDGLFFICATNCGVVSVEMR